MTDKSSKLSTIVFGILFLLGGLAGIGYGVLTVQQANDMESWPTAEAIITYSKVRIQTPDSGGSSTYIADIRYRYAVDGHTYSSDRITTAQYGTDDSSRAHKQVRTYAVGRTVLAYYNPDEPDYAVLETAWDKIYALAFGAGIVAALLGLLMLRNAARD